MLIDSTIRRCLIKRFPYSILYAINVDMIVIIAHLQRELNYWQGRLS